MDHRVQTNLNLLLKKRKIDEKLWNVDDLLQAEVVLASKQRIGAFGLEGNFEDLVTKRQRVRRFQALTAKTEKSSKNMA